MTTRTIQKVKFTLSDDGMVSSSDYPNLGVLDDCQELAGLIWHLFESFNSDINI